MIGTLLLNRYELLEKIGEGGMGIVYKAKCNVLNRFVAVKILKTELNASKDFTTRFKMEANSIAKLSHPNIIGVYDAGSENNINFIVMEYINGKTLKQIIRENVKLSYFETLNIALQIAVALECAHKHNIIHRDIKPDNILITEDNIAKLTDFGIAKVTDSITITYPNKIIGSVHYFSPEQAKGKLIDYRTDIYSLGIVMYEMLTGKVPYNAELPISVAMMHIQDSVIPPKEIIADIPENINRVILKALEKNPINRFQTANELVYILNAIKENSNLEVNFQNKSINDTTIIMEPNSVLSDTEIDSTVIMTKVANSKTSILKIDKKNLFQNNGTRKNKNMILTFGLIILSIIIVTTMWRFIPKDPSTYTNTNVPVAENTVNETVNETSQQSVELLEDKNIPVPSLTGNTQDVAQNIIINNGFLLGNITTEYSDTIPKGLIIRQSPLADVLYEKNKKIDLVISLGQEVNEVILPQTEKKDEVNEVISSQTEKKDEVTEVVQQKGNNGNGKGNGKANENSNKNKDKKVKNN